MTESEVAILNATCPNCGHYWRPFGNKSVIIPDTQIVICPECNQKFKKTWCDSETRKKLAEKELGLSENNDKKIKDLEHRIDLLVRELELEKKKRELFEVKLEKLDF